MTEAFVRETGCRVIAEIAQAHDGSLGTAHAYIDAVAATGADAIKFQTHIAEAESSPDEPWRVKFSPQDDTRFDYWKRMEFTEPQWAGLKKHCDDKGLAFLSSAFSVQAVALLERVGVAAWKIASGQINDLWMLDRIARTGQEVMFSTGMSPLSEIEWAVRWARDNSLPLSVMQCTSEYPSSFENVGLNVLDALRERFRVPVGLSDHTGTIYPSLAAAARGANVVEVHVTFSREAFGPDVPASITLEELKVLVDGVRATTTMLATPVDKDAMAERMQRMRSLFMKSVVVTKDLPQGHMLCEGDLDTKKPASGIPSHHIYETFGKKLTRDVRVGEALTEEDVEG